MLDAKLLGEGIAAIVRKQVAHATAALQAELIALRAELAARPDTKANGEAIARAVGEAFAGLPKPADGTSVTVEQLRPMVDDIVARTVAALPRPVDGASVTIDDVRPVLAAMVDGKFATVPAPKSVSVEDVRPIIDAEVVRRVAELPKPADGESVTLEDVRPIIDAEVARKVAEIPKAKDGESVELDDVLPVIRSEVKAQIADLPKPEDGKSVTIEQVRPLVAELVAMIPTPKDGTSVTIAELLPTVKSMVDALPAPRDGKSITVDDVRPLIEREIETRFAALPVPPDLAAIHERYLENLHQAAAQIPDVVQRCVDTLPKPADGQSVTVDDVRPLIEAEVAERVAALPTPKDGRNGKDGADGHSAFELAVANGFAGTVKDWLGSLRGDRGEKGDAGMRGVMGPPGGRGDQGDAGNKGEAGRDGRDGNPGEHGERGDPGINGKDGHDGMSVDDFELESKDGGRTIAIRMKCGARTVERELRTALPVSVGIYVKGKSYSKGDIATYGGSAFIAERDTNAAIGGDPPSPDWRMLVQRGRDAK